MARHASLIATTTTTNTDVFAESHFKVKTSQDHILHAPRFTAKG
jgi:hypothetical protein